MVLTTMIFSIQERWIWGKEHLGPGVFSPVVKDSGNVEQEVDAFIGELLDGGDGVGEGVFGLNAKLDNMYVGGRRERGDALCKYRGCSG